MARWLQITALRRAGVGRTTWLASAGGFLVAVICVLAFAAVVAANLIFHRRNGKNRGSTSSADSLTHGLKHKFSISRALINSCKRLLFSMKLVRREEENEDDKVKAYDLAVMKEEAAGGGSDLLWQRSILMGERCDPPDFSGIIIYDDKGNRLPQYPPRSPRHNILPASPHQEFFVSERRP